MRVEKETHLLSRERQSLGPRLLLADRVGVVLAEVDEWLALEGADCQAAVVAKLGGEE